MIKYYIHFTRAQRLGLNLFEAMGPYDAPLEALRALDQYIECSHPDLRAAIESESTVRSMFTPSVSINLLKEFD